MKFLRWLVAAGMLGIGMAGANAADAPKAGSKDLFLKGDAVCTACHDENDSPDVLKVGKTRHGVGADKRTPTCTSCHGKSEQHVKDAGRVEKKLTPKVEVGFNSKNPATAQQRNAACLTCHQGDNRIHWQSSLHAQGDVACSSCHKVHTGHDKVRDKLAQAEVCYDCHKEQRSQISRPSHHPVGEGKMACTSCHDVHSGNPKQLIGDSVNETCYSCHMEKRGPFVHNHQPVAEDCSICHNPHGTVLPNLLKARPPYLCQECHSHDSHPSQQPGQPTGATTSSSLLGTVARGCLNCHTNIHGSNSTQNSATVGRFRR